MELNITPNAQNPEQVQNSSAAAAQQTPSTSGRRTRINFVDAGPETDNSQSLTLKEFRSSGQAFYDGLRFRLTGACEKQVVKPGESAPKADAKRHPVFTTSVDGAFIFASSYVRPKADILNRPLMPSGTFDLDVLRILNDPQYDGVKLVDLLSQIAAQVGDKMLRVRRTPFKAIDASGEPYNGTLVNIDYVVD